MNKDIYLEQLYTQLSKYNLDSAMKHVTEYDYIISDMLEEGTMDDVVSKLGSPEELASNIAEEFDYEINDSKQFEDPIWKRKPTYTSHTNYSTVIKIINVLWVIASVIFFFSFGVTAAGLVAVLALFAVVNVPSMIFFGLALICGIIFVIAMYMLVLNLKNLLINRLTENTESEVK